jgi:hypothetical protein
LMWLIVAMVSWTENSALLSRYQSGDKESMQQRPTKARWPAARQRSARRLVLGTEMVA